MTLTDHQAHHDSVPIPLHHHASVTSGKTGIWSLIFRAKAIKAAERRYFGVSRRGGIVHASDGHLYLQYYANHTDLELSTVDVDELQTGSSPNDVLLKVFITTIQLLFVALVPLCLVLHKMLGDSLAAPNSYVILTVFYLLLGAITFFAWFPMENHFVKMDHGWSTAINDLLGQNVLAAMAGIQECMLESRRFVKWRRYLLYLGLLLFSAWIFEALAVIAVVFSFHRDITLVDTLIALSIIIVQAVVFGRLSYLRWFYTKWRDPSLQLCVALAASDRELVQQIRGRSGR